MSNQSDLEKFDTEKMYKIYDQWPEIAKDALQIKVKKTEFDRIKHIVFAGMGGSGTIGDIFAAIFSKTDIHVSVVKGYVLPNTVNSESLVVVTSVSGNTKETITILKNTIKKNCKIIAFSSGGQIENICNENNIDFTKIKENNSPRASLVNFLYTILLKVEKIIPLKNTDIQESISQMEILRNQIFSRNQANNEAKKLADWIQGLPLIYYPFGLQSAAIRFKNSLQENAKLHVIAEDVIEACHNGIVAWENKSDVQPILIQGKDDNEKTKERWDILKKYFENNSIEYFEIYSKSGSILTKIINLIYLLDYASIYKAINSEKNPTPVKSIDFIKDRL